MNESEARKVGEELIKKYLSPEWKLKFNRRKKAAGVCSERRKVIFLSSLYIRSVSDERIYNTLLHEIAHALVGSQNHHNHIWQSTFKNLGGDGSKHCPVFAESALKVICVKCSYEIPVYRKWKHPISKYKHKSPCYGELTYKEVVKNG